MRTDAKIGFAIVGVLLLVLAVYAVVIPRHGKTSAQANNTNRTPVKVEPNAADDHSTPTDPDPLGGTQPTKPTPAAVEPAAKPPVAVPDGPVITNLTAPTNVTVPPVGPVPPVGGITEPHGTRGHSGRLHGDSTPATVASAAHPYRVRPGQTLSSIAAEVYGDSSLSKRIQDDNPGLNPKKLKVGQRIMIPDPADVRPRPAVVLPAADLVVSAPDAEDPVPALTSNIYRVRDGDSLYRIARKCLGSGREADAIYELNRAAIGPDMTHLRTGTVLRLPSPVDGALSDASR